MCEPASGPLVPSLSSRDGERGREEPAGRIAVEEPGNRPWGLWATLGLGLVIGLAFALAQLMVGVVFGVVAVANGHGEILTDPKKMQANGLFLAVTTCGAAPVSIGLTCFFAWLRKGYDAQARCLVVVNFSPNVYHNYRVRVPFAGTWKEALNSDSAHYGGSNVGNIGEVRTLEGAIPELNLTLPPLAAIFLVPAS